MSETTPIVCGICGKTIHLAIIRGKDNNLYLDIQDQLWLKLRSPGSYAVCKECDNVIKKE
jgi:hypothetical protein